MPCEVALGSRRRLPMLTIARRRCAIGVRAVGARLAAHGGPGRRTSTSSSEYFTGAQIMARKSSTKPTAAKRTSTSRPRAKASPAPAKGAGSSAPGRADFGDMAKMARAMTPEQAFGLYKTNAKLALDVINTAIENTSKLRKLQFRS